MRKIISHRGNLNGPNPSRENHPDYIDEAIAAGFDVEVDVWVMNGKLYLGHDYPQYETDMDFFIQRERKLWVHCKNLPALDLMKRLVHAFWHENDQYTLTSYGIIWTYPKITTNQCCIIVLQDKEPPPKECLGFCTDYPILWMNSQDK